MAQIVFGPPEQFCYSQNNETLTEDLTNYCQQHYFDGSENKPEPNLRPVFFKIEYIPHYLVRSAIFKTWSAKQTCLCGYQLSHGPRSDPWRR